MSNGITCENLLLTLPYALQQDKDKVALAKVIANELTTLYHDNRLIAIYTRIDELDEALLDILAKDFSVSWYLYDGTIEEKRAQIKSCFYVHRRLGTKAAVETAISAIYPDTKVSEWFEYGGEPYHFRLLVDATYENVDREKHRRVLERVEFYKNLRSVLDEIEYFANGTALSYAGVAFAGDEIIDGAEAKLY